MRIAAINTVNYGSTGNIMIHIAETTRKCGHEAWTFSMKWRNQKEAQAGHKYFGSFIENALSIRAGKYTGYNGCFAWLGTWKLLRELDRIRPDVIHLHNLHNCYVNLPMLFRYLKKKKIKVVWTLHDCWAFTGQCPYFELAQCHKWKTGCHHCPVYRQYPAAAVDRTKTMWKWKKKWFTGMENMTLVTPSQWLADLVKQSYLGEYPVQVIHNGIDLSVFQPVESTFREKYGIGRDQFVVLGVAFGWGKRKGLDAFIELSKRLDSRYKIVLVGTDAGVDAQLPENILSIHRTHNQQELAEIYTAADVFANPTREEVLGMVNVEASACGTPVVTFKTGGSPECIDETCGCVVECDDVAAMEREIVRICTQRPYSQAACRSRAKFFDMNSCFREYVSLYETL